MSMAVSGYMRQFYKGNPFGVTQTGRASKDNCDLVSADIKAIKRAVKELGDYDYDDGEGSELMNKVQAFVNTYNNYIDSAKGMEDSNMDRYLSKCRKLTKENADELADIGVTIQASGKLKVDKKALQDTGRYQVSKLFSKDAEYSQEIEKQMRRTASMMQRNNLHIKKKPQQTNNSQATRGTQQDAANPASAGTQPGVANAVPVAIQADGTLLAQAMAGSQINYTV